MGERRDDDHRAGDRARAELSESTLRTGCAPSVMAFDPEGRGLIIMPSGHFYYFSDRDLGDIIAYLKSIPPVDREWPEPEFSALGKILIGAGILGNVIEAETY
jgi:hypothetical protein